MWNKIIPAMAAAALLASTGLASAQGYAPNPQGYYQGYYDVVPYAGPDATQSPDRLYPFPVTGQSGA